MDNINSKTEAVFINKIEKYLVSKGEKIINKQPQSEWGQESCIEWNNGNSKKRIEIKLIDIKRKIVENNDFLDIEYQYNLEFKTELFIGEEKYILIYHEIFDTQKSKVSHFISDFMFDFKQELNGNMHNNQIGLNYTPFSSAQIETLIEAGYQFPKNKNFVFEGNIEYKHNDENGFEKKQRTISLKPENFTVKIENKNGQNNIILNNGEVIFMKNNEKIFSFGNGEYSRNENDYIFEIINNTENIDKIKL